jgi:hypothetical protein
VDYNARVAQLAWAAEPSPLRYCSKRETIAITLYVLGRHALRISPIDTDTLRTPMPHRLTVADVGRCMGVGRETVKTLLARARQKVLRAIDE